MLAGCKLDESLTVGSIDDIDMLNGIPAAEHHIIPAELMNQFIADLLIQKFQRTRALIDHRHGHTQSGKHRSVFNADYTGSHNRKSPRKMLQPHNIVGGDDGLSIRLHIMWFAGTCTY